ncbi:MAG: hypothetical protein JXR68_03685 [Bacteroidales bacterium]|nr:hypothetical protein [Bacteroidales bacterium]
MNILYVKNKEIDKKKWDNCLLLAENGLIYGCSWYLDIVCDTWDALIADDYKFVLPLPVKKKYFFKAVHKPVYVQKFNVFGNNLLPNIVEKFIEKIPSIFINFSVSLGCNYSEFVSNFDVTENKSQILFLNNSYEELFNNFDKAHKKNTRKAIKNGVVVNETQNINNVVLMKREVHKNKNILLQDIDYQKLLDLVTFNVLEKGGEIFDAFYENNLIATAFFAKFKNTYTLFSGNSILARKLGASYIIINEFIRKHQNSNVAIDFAGSNIKSIADWNLGFGAHNIFYYSFSKKHSAVYNFFSGLLR